MKKLLLIYNPTAGKAQFCAKLDDTIDYYTKHQFIVTAYPTQARLDGYQFIRQYGNDFDLIICAGGDGTLNEIVSAMLDSQNTVPFGYIPCGSTNDFARSIGIPSVIDEAVVTSCSDNTVYIDIGVFNDKHFVYVAGFGLFTDVSYATSQELKNNFGYLAYILEGIKALSDIQVYHITLEYEQGLIQGEFILGLVMNSYSVGGFKNPFSDLIQLDDGLFEVVLVRMPKNFAELQSIVAAMITGAMISEHIVYIHSTELKIISQPIEWTIDGEYGGVYDTVVIQNKQRAMRIITSS